MIHDDDANDGYWSRYAPELPTGFQDADFDELVERGQEGTSEDWARSLRLMCLWAYNDPRELDSRVHRIMNRAARLRDPYAILWRAELIEFQGYTGRAFRYLSQKHQFGVDARLDRVVNGLLAGWAWRAWGSRRYGAALPSLYTSTLDELAIDAAQWFISIGEPEQARMVFEATDDSGEHMSGFYLASWLYRYQARKDEAKHIAEASANDDPHAARLLGEMLLEAGETRKARYWLKRAAPQDRHAVRLLRRSTRRIKRAKNRT